MASTVIIQGEDRTIEFKLLDETDNEPVNLTGVTAIQLTTAGTAGNVTFLQSATEISVTDAIKGKIAVVMSDTKTSTLKVGTQNVEFVVDWGVTRRIFQGLAALVIKKKLF